ncbi:amidohydrolase family protein [Klebsiella variicola]|uniref:Amidohydrolase family protein n=1 Tax=Klebsiella variicola TaxID=244366 RepID=A0A7H4MCP4_KLEVA|nr:amidohydrolase family protein [Klebsiella variicola]
MSRTLEHFNYLHQIPELGFEEYKTSAYIGDALAAAGFRVHRNVGGTTGIVAESIAGNRGQWWRYGQIWMRWAILSMAA